MRCFEYLNRNPIVKDHRTYLMLQFLLNFIIKVINIPSIDAPIYSYVKLKEMEDKLHVVAVEDTLADDEEPNKV